MMGAGLGLGLVSAVIGIFIGAVFLWVTAAKIFKLKDKSFKTPLIISAIAGVVSFVLKLLPLGIISSLVVILLGVWLVKTRYHVDWVKSILVWLVNFVLAAVVMFVLAFVFGGMFAGIGMMS
jgi:hypothetical protein